MQEIQAIPPYMHTKEVAAFLGVSPETISRWRRDRDFPAPIRMSATKHVYKSQDVIDWLEVKR